MDERARELLRVVADENRGALEALDAEPVNEVGIQVSTGDDAEVFAHVEQMIMSIGAPFVPLEHEGVIYVRPPLS